jgi:hypothetical protein
MNYYPLLETTDFAGFVTLANFPPTEKWKPKVTYIYGAQSDGRSWIIYPCGSLEPGQTRRLNRSSTQFIEGKSIFFFMSDQPTLLAELSELPAPNKYQCATPRWRGTLGISSDMMETSYSGEYPDEMLPLAKSSCISLSPLLQGGEGRQTTILFINMILKPQLSTYNARLIKADTKAILQEWTVTSNCVNQCKVRPDLHYELDSSLAHFVVDGITGIPVYFSSNQVTGTMSLEHSHPPIEFLVFGEARMRTALVRSIKKEWL